MEFPSRYNLTGGGRDVSTGSLSFDGDDGCTRQEFREECDINVLMSRYITRGVVPPSVGIGLYGDFSEVGDYQEALDTIQRAKAQFDWMDARVRERFKNDPAKLLEFIMDKGNLEEAKKLGLLKLQEPQAPASAPQADVAPTK